jgi:hypothetical protein
MLEVSIPPPVALPPKPEGYDVAEETGYVFRVRVILFNDNQFMLTRMSNASFIMNNINHISVLSNSSCEVEFPVLFITSLPTRCILTSDPFLHNDNLSCNITVVPSNDTYPKIILFNSSKHTINLYPRQLAVNCKIAIANFDHISFNM